MHQIKFIFTLSALLAMFLFFSCNNVENTTQSSDPNPPANGFDLEGSDTKAIEIADEVMLAMGGRTNWDQTRIIKWNFFGSRLLVWDKWSGDVRIEDPKENSTTLVNIKNKKGQVKVGDVIHESIDSIAKYIEAGRTKWINDSYWLFMPFKLKDSGVTLKYIGIDTTEAGKAADLLQLTFNNVGISPEHKYYVYVDTETRLVSEWAFFNKAEAEKPIFKTPWNNYTQHGHILLSDERGKGRLLSDIQVFDELPEAVFRSLDPVDWSTVK
ncbi:MAG: hypothetical protein AAF502_10630 [Bacteroidota bacterium]